MNRMHGTLNADAVVRSQDTLFLQPVSIHKHPYVS